MRNTPTYAQKRWYVYMLCDPDTEVPFYIGKGTGDRIDDHERFVNSGWHAMNEEKNRVIRRILAEGKRVLKKIVAEFDVEGDAYAYEHALINSFHGQLTNMHPGGGGKYTQSVKEIKETSVGLSYACKLLGISRKELRKMVWRGEIGHSAPQGMFFYLSELQDYLASHATITDETPAKCAGVVDETSTGSFVTADDILDAEDVGGLLRIHPRTVIRLATQGQLPGFKVGGQWRFKRQDIENYIEEQKRKYIDRNNDE